MKAPKVNINRTSISTEEILARKNFQTLLKVHQVAPIQQHWIHKLVVKKMFAIAGTAVVTSGAIVGYILYNPEKMNNETISVTAAPKRENTPEKNVAIQEEVIADTINTSNIVFEEVEEFSEPVVVRTTPVRTFRREKPAAQPKSSTPQNASLLAEIEKLRQEIYELNMRIDQMENEIPAKPPLTKGYRFRIDLAPGEFPKISKFKNVLFEVPQEETNFSPDFMKREWDKGKISEDGEGKYKLTLTKGKESYSFKVRLVPEEQEALALQKYKNHHHQIDSLVALEKSKSDALHKLEK